MTESLGGGWLQRRRLLSELEHHLEDCVDDLRQAGLPEDAAVHDAIARLGDVDTIASAVRAAHSPRPLSWHGVTRVAIAWIAVGAMSIVTFAALELPQASGAKATKLQLALPAHVGARPANRCCPEHHPTGQQATRRSHLVRLRRCR